MGWQENLQEASFRNIPFFVPDHTVSGGRRKVVHIFPGRDSVHIEDLGKMNPTFVVNAYVFGDDYFAYRNALQDVLERPGSGTLVHPYYGSMLVEVATYTVSERFDEGRMARFEITFLKAGSAIYSEQRLSLKSDVVAKRRTLMAAINDVFLKSYSIVRKPYNVVSQARQAITNGLTVVANVKSIYNTVPEFRQLVDRTLQDADKLVRDANGVVTATNELLLFGTLPTDPIQPITDLTARAMFYSLQTVYNSVGYLTPEQLLDPAMQATKFMAESALAVTAGLMIGIEYTSYLEAMSFQRVLFNRIDLELNNPNITDAVFSAWADLRVSVRNDLEARSGTAAQIYQILPTVPVPALVLAYDLYGDISMEGDILRRNNVVNPGFVPGGRSVEVLLA